MKSLEKYQIQIAVRLQHRLSVLSTAQPMQRLRELKSFSELLKLEEFRKNTGSSSTTPYPRDCSH